MARSAIPDPLDRRHLLEGEVDVRRAQRIADAYLEEKRRMEALAFLGRAEDRERLAAIADEAVEEGDLFLLRAASRALGEDPPADAWERLARAAEARGKDRYAADARRQAARREE